MALQPNALCSVEDITARGVSKASSIIEDSINAISDEFEYLAQRVFRSIAHVAEPSGDGQAPLEWVPGSGGRLLQVYSFPITAVDEVKIDGQVVTDYSWELPGYGEAGLLYRLNGWPRSCGVHDWLTMDPNPLDPILSISLAYTGGYATTPADLKLACIAEVMRDVTRPLNQHIQNERTPGGWSRTLATGVSGGNGKAADFADRTITLLTGKYLAPKRDRPAF